MMHEEALQVLATEAKRFGTELSEEQLALFRVYLDELTLWNQKVNLTGAKSAARVITELFLDSLVPSAEIPAKTILLDAGSGAGLPGLPLKIVHPSLGVHLLEPRAKRVSFLRHVVRLLGLAGIEVIQGRTERGSAVFPVDCYPVITARALASFPKTLRWCASMLCNGGMLVCYLGEHGPKEVDSGMDVAREEGLEVEKIVPYSLPGKKGRRHVVIMRKAAGQG